MTNVHLLLPFVVDFTLDPSDYSAVIQDQIMTQTGTSCYSYDISLLCLLYNVRPQ